MTPETKTGIVGVVALMAGLGIGSALPHEPLPGDIENAAVSKVAFLADGSKIYTTEVSHTDGGVTVIYRAAPPCKRKPKGAKNCARLDGGDPGEMNRYPASELTGASCEGVACSIWAGEDPDAPEAPK